MTRIIAIVAITISLVVCGYQAYQAGSQIVNSQTERLAQISEVK